MFPQNWSSSRCRSVLFASLFTATLPGCHDAPPGSISVEPPIVRLTDRIYPENEYVSVKFHIVNPLDMPVMVTDLKTSCGCTTAIVDGGKNLPVEVSAKGTLDFQMKAFGTAKPEPFQTFVVNISSECKGRSLPDVTASLQFRVDDPLRAFPLSLVAAGLPLRPARRSISLVTRSSSTAVPKLELKVSDPESIRADLNEPGPVVGDSRGFKTHYTVDVTVTPKREEPTVTGIISVISGDRAIQTIPVQFSFVTPFNLSLREINVNGSPGDQVGKEIYYEAHDPEWRDVDVAYKPDNIGVAVDQFDKRTQRFRFTIKVPALGSLRGPITDEECIVLKSRRGSHEIKLPVRYELARSASTR